MALTLINANQLVLMTQNVPTRREAQMEFLQAFPIAIIDEDFEGKHAAGRGMRQLAEAHPDGYARLGLKDFCEHVHKAYREVDLPKAQRDMYTTLPEVAMRPADAYDRLVRGRVESVEIDQLIDRTPAVMVAPYPPGIPLIMPGERITAATKSIQDYLLYAREFDRTFPGFETDIHGLRFESTAGGKRYLVDCVTYGSER